MTTLTPNPSIAIMASGTGTTLQFLIDNLPEHNIDITAVICNNKSAQALERARQANLKWHHIPAKAPMAAQTLARTLKASGCQLVVLAGYMVKIPPEALEAVDHQMINTHPALLPKFGGQGMYGDFVHEAVLRAKEPRTGATVHWVNEIYDDGAIIEHKTVDVSENDTIDSLRARVQTVEKTLLLQTIVRICSRKP